MMASGTIDLSYFPGCSMVTSAKESNASLIQICQRLGLNLIELEDWNCCGSSSAHSIEPGLAFRLAARNLSLATPEKPLMIMCPGCLHRLKAVHKQVKDDPELRLRAEKACGRPINPDVQIIHFFEILEGFDFSRTKDIQLAQLDRVKFVPYYGCMLAHPPAFRKEKNYHQLIEKILTSLGAEALPWGFSAKCCGTFLAAARPDIATPLVNKIIAGAVRAGAECIVTACAMCQLNLEIRCSLKEKIPTLHFSEILALALGEKGYDGWFKRHLVDPRPLLRKKGLIS